MAQAESYITSSYFLQEGNAFEFYALIGCKTKDVCSFNGVPTIFAFDGTTNKDIHPDKMLGKVISEIITPNQTKIKGCFRFEEIACPEENYQIINFSDFFFGVTIALSAKEALNALPKTASVLPTYEIIYPEATAPNDLIPAKVEKIMSDFTEVMYIDMMHSRTGVTFHTRVNTLDATMNFELLKLQMLEDSKICCPTT